MEAVIRSAQTIQAPLPVAVALDSPSLRMGELVQVWYYSSMCCLNSSVGSSSLKLLILLLLDAAVNACQEGNNCEQLCSSGNDGTFTCSCETGFTLNPDGSTCNGVDVNLGIHKMTTLTTFYVYYSHRHR